MARHTHLYTIADDEALKVLLGVDALIAREVTKEGKTLTLRDAAGRPMWARARRGT